MKEQSDPPTSSLYIAGEIPQWWTDRFHDPFLMTPIGLRRLGVIRKGSWNVSVHHRVFSLSMCTESTSACLAFWHNQPRCSKAHICRDSWDDWSLLCVARKCPTLSSPYGACRTRCMHNFYTKSVKRICCQVLAMFQNWSNAWSMNFQERSMLHMQHYTATITLNFNHISDFMTPFRDPLGGC